MIVFMDIGGFGEFGESLWRCIWSWVPQEQWWP